MTPFRKKDKQVGRELDVPCGSCPECLARRTSAWSFRLMEECKVSSSCVFITLTYDTKHVPITEKGYMSISVRDCQLFFKRLRKAHSSCVKIKYFIVGEYGGVTLRPHYHCILFNADVTKIQSAWGMGSIHYGTVSGASVGYTLKYIMKKGKIPMHSNDDRMKEFACMSKGLGKCYLSRNMVKWHKADLKNRMYLNLEGGKKCSMPRYFKERIYDEDERKIIAAEHERKLNLKRDEMVNSVGYAKFIDDRNAGIEAAFRKKESLKKEKLKL